MNYQMKQMIVDSILKVINNSPIKTYSNDFSRINRDVFDVWFKYANSILDIFSDNKSIVMDIINTKNRILSISLDSNDYPYKIVQINQVLLDLANKIFYNF